MFLYVFCCVYVCVLYLFNISATEVNSANTMTDIVIIGIEPMCIPVNKNIGDSIPIVLRDITAILFFSFVFMLLHFYCV